MLTSDTELSEGEGCSCKTDGQLWALLLRQFRKELARALVCEFAGSTAGGLASRQCQGLKKRMTPAALLLTVIARRSIGAPSSMAQSSVRVFDCMDLQSLHHCVMRDFLPGFAGEASPRDVVGCMDLQSVFCVDSQVWHHRVMLCFLRGFPGVACLLRVVMLSLPRWPGPFQVGAAGECFQSFLFRR